MASAFALGFAAAVLVIVVYSHGDVGRMTSGDGLFSRYVAQHLDATPDSLDPIVAARGPSLRYGRIGLPAAIWLLSAGRPGGMRYAQPVIMALAAGVIAVATSRLFPERATAIALLPFLAVGLTLSVAGGYTEALAVAFTLWAVVATMRERWAAASILLALAMLTRENCVLILGGALVWSGSRKRWWGAAILAASILPVAAWHLIVAARFGHLPLTDPYVWAGAHTPRLPFVSLARGFTDYGDTAAVTAGIHVALWIVAFVVARRSLFGVLAVAAGLQLALVPLLNWQYAGDTFRLFVLLEVFTVLALAAARSRSPDAEAR
jgi:hypothetical protein